MVKENLRQFIFKKLEAGEYVLDADIAKFGKGENTPFYQAEVYKREYMALESQKNEFDDHEGKTISSYKNSYKNAKTKYFLRYEGMEENRSWKITKAYFLYLKSQGVIVSL